MAVPKKSEEIAHKEFLKFQKQLEQSVNDLHQKTNETLQKIIARNVNVDGRIDKFKIKKIVDMYMVNELRDYRKKLTAQIKSGVSSSSKLGIRSVIASVDPTRKITALKWQNTAKRIRKNIINKRGIDGLTLSERVWKLTSDDIHQLKKIIAGDILNGNSAAKISRDIRGFLIQPKTLRGRVKDLLKPGRGVYKSAYKNAMRVTRTETARAYIDGQKEVAKAMGYKMQLKLSSVHTACPICDPVADKIYDPDDFPLPLHPHCMCYGIDVLPT